MIVKTIFVIKHAFGPFEVDSIGPVSETTNDIRSNRIFSALSVRSLCEVVMKPTMRAALSTITKLRKDKSLEVNTSFKALLNSMPQEVLTSTRTD